MNPALHRAARALRDPWSLLAAGLGAGVAWAVDLSLGGVGAVGVGMLGVAAVVSAATDRGTAAADLPERSLRPGTVQFQLVSTLETYLADLIRLQGGSLTPVLSGQATEAVEAARSARTVAVDVAASVDALDGALGQAGQVARQMTAVNKVAGPLRRMQARRRELLGKLTSAVDGVGELYTKLLELAAIPGFTDHPTVDQGLDPVAEVNDSLDAIRGAFAELESAARTTSADLRSPGSV